MDDVKVYVSGPVSNRSFKEAKKHFRRIATELRSRGLIPVDPTLIEQSSSPEENALKGWEDFMREGIKSLMDCDAIYMLEGYEHSRGAKLELQIADKLGMHIWYEKYGDFIAEQELLNE
tara:strand:- start:194 stop:550 length:357 start_codon:yes stop_codon:yes gene_type:complete